MIADVVRGECVESGGVMEGGMRSRISGCIDVAAPVLRDRLHFALLL